MNPFTPYFDVSIAGAIAEAALCRPPVATLAPELAAPSGVASLPARTPARKGWRCLIHAAVSLVSGPVHPNSGANSI